jgi:FixJ family two-component response regulator
MDGWAGMQPFGAGGVIPCARVHRHAGEKRVEPQHKEIFVIDDDPNVREILALALELDGFRASGFEDGAAFLSALRLRTPDCILLDVGLPGQSGLDILKELHRTDVSAPILMISGRGDIPTAIDAIRHGALDFIEKPFDVTTIVSRVRNVVESWAGRRPAQADLLAGRLVSFPGRDLLTPREHEVLAKIATGDSNKEAGRALGISPRTVEVHRARIMDKLGAKNTADLMRIVLSESTDVSAAPRRLT